MPENENRRALALAVTVILIFAPTALQCGLYLDDYGFVNSLTHISPAGLWRQFIEYVPGRNLHIPFFYLMLRLTGGSAAAMHGLSVICDAVTAIVVYRFVRRMSGLSTVAWTSALAFIAVPNHGETHFWLTAIPQNQLSTLLALCAFLLATYRGINFKVMALSVYAVSLFTYDQVFFLWPLLLYTMWRSDEAPRAGRYVFLGGICLSLDLAHLALRYLSPYASGGRPLIRFADVLLRSRDMIVAIGKGLIPVPTPSYIDSRWSILIMGAALAGGYWIYREALRTACDEKEKLDGWASGFGCVEISVFGLFWMGLAYAPNLFWFISPRHNYLPSFGLVLAAVSIGGAAIVRASWIRRIAPFLAIPAFALVAVADVHEGTQWLASRGTHDSFAREVRRMSPPVENVFVVGAPRYLHRAPLFNLPHDVALAATRELDGAAVFGDYEVTPTRTGIVYWNDLSIASPEAFRWVPANAANVVSYDKSTRGIECLGALDVQEPLGSARRLSLRPNPDCIKTFPLTAQVALTKSEIAADSTGTRSSGSGITLLRAEVRKKEVSTSLVLEWMMGRTPHGVLALVPRLKDRNGKLLLDTIFPSNSNPAPRDYFRESFSTAYNPERPYPMLWPLVDDVVSSKDMRPGRILRETFEIRRSVDHDDGSATLEVDLYEFNAAGIPQKIGTFASPAKVLPSA